MIRDIIYRLESEQKSRNRNKQRVLRKGLTEIRWAEKTKAAQYKFESLEKKTE